MTICYFCRGKVIPRRIQHIHHWGDRVYIFEDVPAEVCEQCGEVYFAPNVLAEMDRIVASKSKPTATIQVPVYTFA